MVFSDIKYIEGQGDYIKVHLVAKMLVVHQTLKSFSESLPDEEFMRIHKSFLVNLKHIEFIEGNQVKVGDHYIPVSLPNREELIQRFSSL